jgi:DUF971 family protein
VRFADWTPRSPPVSLGSMRPIDLQVIGEELAIQWDDGKEGYVRLEILRRHCPCASCKGETDVLGNVYRGPALPLTAEAFTLRHLQPVGRYAVQPIWGDGHGSGIFTFELLRQLSTPDSP